MRTASISTSHELKALQQALAAQSEQIAEISKTLGTVLDTRELAKLSDQVASFRQALSGVEAKLSRNEEILALLDEYQFAAASEDADVLKQLRNRWLAARVRNIIEAELPAESAALVVTKGDELLVKSKVIRCGHFPQSADGEYAGFHPADSGSAIIQLEALRAKGAEYLVFPSTSFWWFEHYSRFHGQLELRYPLVHRSEHCVIYALATGSIPKEKNSRDNFLQTLCQLERDCDHELGVLDWTADQKLAERFPGRLIFAPPCQAESTTAKQLPYLDKTIDVVVIAGHDELVLAEARRVATMAIMKFEGTAATQENFSVELLSGVQQKPLPSVSIIIPSYNGRSLTANCLRALQETVPDAATVQVLVVDDASTDDTQNAIQHFCNTDHRITLLRNAENLGFVATCNRGAKAATGDVLVFLNNDTLPQPGWLEAMLEIFNRFPEAGAVGAKLVYPDGRLQEAGGVIFSDGSAANVGRGDFQVDGPLYNYVRDVDYVTGACIATPRRLFEQLDGLDLRYRPIYYEETDYCFRVREAGFKVYYQPLSVIIHLEGVTCGTDASTGPKRYQIVNQQKFIERWQHVLPRQPKNPSHFDTSTWYALAVRDEFLNDRSEPVSSDLINQRALAIAHNVDTNGDFAK